MATFSSTIPEQSDCKEDFKLSARRRRRTKKRLDVEGNSGVSPANAGDSAETTSFSNTLATIDLNTLELENESSKKNEGECS